MKDAKKVVISRAQYREIINYMFDNDCWFEYACEVLGFSPAVAEAAKDRFEKQMAEEV